MNCRRFLIPCLIAVFGLTGHLPAQIVTFNWSGAHGNYYHYSGNWAGGTLPPNDGSAAISFGNAASTFVYTEEGILVLGIQIDAFGRPYFFSGNTIRLGQQGITYDAPQQGPEDHFSQINNPLVLAANQTWDIKGGRLSISSGLSDSSTGDPYHLTKTGAGTLEFRNSSSAANTWSGGLTVLDGRILIHPKVDYNADGQYFYSAPTSALGTGAVTFDSSQGGNPTLSASDWIDSTQGWPDPLRVILPNAIRIKGTLNLENQATLNLTGGVTLLSDATLNMRGNPLFITSPIGDGGDGYRLVVDGYGLVVLNPEIQAGSVEPLNTYSGGTHVENGGLVFTNEYALPASGSLTMSPAGYIGYGSTTGVAGFLGKFEPQDAAGTIGFDSDPEGEVTNNFSDAIDLSGFNTGVRLGSATFATLGGTLTPAGAHYRFGGGGGKLTVNSLLTNAGEGGAIPRAVVMDSHPAQPLTVWLMNSANTFTGGAQASRGALIFGPGALPAAGSLSLGIAGYIGTTTAFETDTEYANHIARFIGSQGIIGFDSLPTALGARTISNALTLPAGYYLGTASRRGSDETGFGPGLIISGFLTGPTEGGNEVFRFAAYKGGHLQIASDINKSNGKVYIGDPSSLGTFGDPNQEEYSVVALTGNNTYGGTTTLYTGHLAIGQSNAGYGTTPTTALGTGALIVQPHSISFPGLDQDDDFFPLLSVLAHTTEPDGPMIIANQIVLNNSLGLGGGQSMRLTNTISGSGGLYIGEDTPNGINVHLEGENTFTGGIHIKGSSSVFFVDDTSAGHGRLSMEGSGATAVFNSMNPVIYGLESREYSTITLALGSTLTIDQEDHTTFRGEITPNSPVLLLGSGGLAPTTNIVKTGDGSIRFTESQYVDNFFINSGTVIASQEGESSANYLGDTLHLQGGTILLQNVTLRSNLTLVSGTIAGNGYILPEDGASPVIGAGLALSPGSAFEGGIGQLTFDELTLASDGLYVWNLRGMAGQNPADAGRDHVMIGAPSTLSVTATAEDPFVISAVTLNSAGANGIVGGFVAGETYTWNLMSYLSINGVTEQFNPSNFLLQTGQFFQTDLPGYTSLEFTNLSGSGSLLLHFTAVPEPSTYALLALGLGFVGFTVWRRRRAS